MSPFLLLQANVAGVLSVPVVRTVPLGGLAAFAAVCDGVAGPLASDGVRGSVAATFVAGQGVAAAAANLVQQALEAWPAWVVQDGGEPEGADNASAAVAVLH